VSVDYAVETAPPWHVPQRRAMSGADDGWTAHEGKDAFRGEKVAHAPRSGMNMEDFIERVKDVCIQRGFGGFVVEDDGAYFRGQTPYECLKGLKPSNATFYIHGPSCFGVGQRVKTFGLKTESLNGIEGKVIRLQDPRVVVGLPGHGEKALKPANLEAMEPPPKSEKPRVGQDGRILRVEDLPDEDPLPDCGRLLTEYVKTV